MVLDGIGLRWMVLGGIGWFHWMLLNGFDIIFRFSKWFFNGIIKLINH